MGSGPGHVGVGDGDLSATAAVAERARIGAGRLRPDLERALGGDPGDGATPRAHRDHVDHRDLARVGAHTPLGGERGFPVEHHADVGGGPAAVAGQHPVETSDLGDQGCSESAGGRPGEHGGDRLVNDLPGTEHASVGLHHVERHAATAVRLESLGDVRDVPAEARLDRGVDQCGDRAFVLAILAEHLAGHRHHGVRVLLGEDGTHPLLVIGVGVGVQERHADRVDAAASEPACDVTRAGFVELADLGSGEVEAATDSADQVPGHDARRLDPEVGVAVAVGDALASDLEHGLVALGGDEAESPYLALEELVRGDGRAVTHGGERLALPRLKSQQREHLLDAGHEAVSRIVGRGRGLGGDELAGVLVQGDHVGEGASRVDADPDPAQRRGLVGHATDSIGTLTRPARAHLVRPAGRGLATPHSE